MLSLTYGTRTWGGESHVNQPPELVRMVDCGRKKSAELTQRVRV